MCIKILSILNRNYFAFLFLCLHNIMRKALFKDRRGRRHDHTHTLPFRHIEYIKTAKMLTGVWYFAFPTLRALFSHII